MIFSGQNIALTFSAWQSLPSLQKLAQVLKLWSLSYCLCSHSPCALILHPMYLLNLSQGIVSMTFLPTVNCSKARPVSWVKADCPLFTITSRNRDRFSGNAVEIIWNWSWNFLCNDFDIFSHSPDFNVKWVIWAHLVTHFLFSGIHRLCHSFLVSR